jgi:hypothetical protein
VNPVVGAVPGTSPAYAVFGAAGGIWGAGGVCGIPGLGTPAAPNALARLLIASTIGSNPLTLIVTVIFHVLSFFFIL